MGLRNENTAFVGPKPRARMNSSHSVTPIELCTSCDCVLGRTKKYRTTIEEQGTSNKAALKDPRNGFLLVNGWPLQEVDPLTDRPTLGILRHLYV